MVTIDDFLFQTLAVIILYQTNDVMIHDFLFHVVTVPEQ